MTARIIAIDEPEPPSPIGAMHTASFAEDPKHLAFVLTRYKFVGKMLIGCQRVLEVGCGDGTGMRVVRQFVPQVVGIDCVAYGHKNYRPVDQIYIHDMVRNGPFRLEVRPAGNSLGWN